ncbi:MAG: glycosyltransferase [Vicinamibacterales bacterium]
MASVLFLARSLGVGGAERQLVVLAKGLHARGHRVIVACFYGGGALEADLAQSGVAVVDLEKRGRWETMRFLARLVLLVRRERPNVMHGYLPVPNMLVSVLRPLARGARIVWGVRASDMDFSRYDLLERLSFRVGVPLARLAHLIIANSWAGAEYHVARGYPRSIVHVVPNGIDTSRFRPDPAARSSLRAEWLIADVEPLVGIVARLDPMKGHEVFLRAIALARRDIPNVRAVCIGDGAELHRSSLRRLATELGLDDVLRWTGAVQDTARVYNALDVLCSASVFGEGFSNAVGEALACGTPCVVTDVGDSARLVGALGRVVPAGDASALAEAIVLTVREGTARQRDARRQLIVDEYGVERLVDRSEALLFVA